MVVVVIWMIYPRNVESISDTAADSVRTVTAIPEGQSLPENADILTVRASVIRPQTYTKQIRVRGRTQAFRHVQVRAEQAGRIVAEPVSRGARVKRGDVLCEIAVDNRDSDLNEARSRLEQAEFEYDAALDLQERGLQSDVTVAQFKTSVAISKAAVNRAELALVKTRIVAPFDGVVETRVVEIGDLLNVGTVCASVLDDSPMLLVGLVPEQDVNQVSVGARVVGKLLDGELVQGTVTYLARAADAISRSYRIEVEIDDNEKDIREGITAELMVEAAITTAHLIPSSALTLDDSGLIGVKLIDHDNSILFRNVEIIGDDTSKLNPGIWVSGLDGAVILVTLGQEIVFPGQVVESNYDWSK